MNSISSNLTFHLNHVIEFTLQNGHVWNKVCVVVRLQKWPNPHPTLEGDASKK